MIYNVGTIAGQFDYVKDLLLMIFQMSINRPIPIVDQAVFNYLVSQQPYLNKILKTTNRDGWAIQLGVTEEAIKAGSGDIGLKAKNDPSYMKIFSHTLLKMVLYTQRKMGMLSVLFINMTVYHHSMKRLSKSMECCNE
jgi:hypothetical protein